MPPVSLEELEQKRNQVLQEIMEKREVDQKRKYRFYQRNCGFCNRPFFIYKSKTKYLKNGGLYCSRNCYFQDHFKAMKIIGRGGYIILSFRRKDGSTAYIDEHRIIMETWLGRKLKKGEQVHHINKNQADNRIENLSVLSIIEHKQIHNRKYFGELCKYHKCSQLAICKNLCHKHYDKERIENRGT